MPLQRFSDLRPSGQISSSEFNRLTQAVEEQDRITGTPEMIVQRNAGGFQIIPNGLPNFWAKLTSSSGSGPTAHAWTEQQELPTGLFQDLPGGRSGTTSIFPAYATDGSAVAANTIPRLYLGVGGDFYLFAPPGAASAGSLEVKQSNGFGDTTGVTVIIIDQVTGLSIESTSGTTVTLRCLDASATQTGVVNLSDQTLGNGNKTFQKDIRLPDTKFGGAPGLGRLQWGNSVYLEGTDTNGPNGGPALWLNRSSGPLPADSYFVCYLTDAGTTIAFSLPYGPDYLGRYECNGFQGITASGLTSVDTQGGIVVGGTSPLASVAPLVDRYADAGNSTTSETDLYSDTIVPNRLANNGDKITAIYAGTLVSSATATRQLRVYFGGTLIFDSGTLSLSVAGDFVINVLVIRDSSTSVRCCVWVNLTGASTGAYANYQAVTGLTLSSAQTMKVTGQAAGVGAATNDIVAKMASVEFAPVVASLRVNVLDRAFLSESINNAIALTASVAQTVFVNDSNGYLVLIV